MAPRLGQLPASWRSQKSPSPSHKGARPSAPRRDARPSSSRGRTEYLFPRCFEEMLREILHGNTRWSYYIHGGEKQLPDHKARHCAARNIASAEHLHLSGTCLDFVISWGSSTCEDARVNRLPRNTNPTHICSWLILRTHKGIRKNCDSLPFGKQKFSMHIFLL